MTKTFINELTVNFLEFQEAIVPPYTDKNFLFVSDGTSGLTAGNLYFIDNSASIISITDGGSLTGANVGTGIGIFLDKTSSTLNFKSLVIGRGINLVDNGNDITVEVNPGYETITLSVSTDPDPNLEVTRVINDLGSTTIGTLADGTYYGQVKNICVTQITASGTYQLNITTYVNTPSISFSATGSARLIWTEDGWI